MTAATSRADRRGRQRRLVPIPGDAARDESTLAAGHPPERRAIAPPGGRPLRAVDPRSVNGYRLVARLGSGGTADVFSASSAAGAPVVVKLFRNAARTVEVCRREFRLSYAVGADCTAAALGYGVSAAGAYLVHAYLPGYRSATTLTGALDPATLRRFGAALADTLHTVHSRGIVHCDVKPSNLLVRGDDVRVIDFGIARYTGQLCGAGGFIECSRGWAAPEQLRNGPATPAVDVFAWGCVVAYLASGVHPFAGDADDGWVRRLRSAEPDLRDLPADLEPTVRAALGRDPGDRPTTRQLVAVCR